MFEQMYRCYPMSQINKEELDKGDKIIMPSSALERLDYLEIEYPMLFHLRNPASGKVTHCGVLEFTADEGRIYLPSWMMETLLLAQTDILVVKYASLSKGTYVKLQPHTKDLLDMSNPRAMLASLSHLCLYVCFVASYFEFLMSSSLEKTLRNYSCLTSGGTIVIYYNNNKFYIDILETKPSHAVCIIETDCEVEFAPPLDYVQPQKPAALPEVDDEEAQLKVIKSSSFAGSARRLDGKASTQQVEPLSKNDGSKDSTTKSSHLQQSGSRLVFGKRSESSQDPTLKEENKFKAFSGRKYLLRG